MPELCTDVLQVVSEDEVEKFHDIFTKDWPLSGYAYSYFKTCYSWRERNPDYDASFYFYKDNIESGIFVSVLNTGEYTFGLVVYASEGYENELSHVLNKTKIINWNKLPLIQGILPRHYTLVEDIVKKKGLKTRVYCDTTMQLLNNEKALSYQIRCPHNVYLAQLTEKDVNTIYDLWPLRDVHTKDDVINSIEMSLSYGLYDRENNELLAWVLQTHYGAIGMLYTKESVRRNGYAKVLVMLMAKKLAEEVIQPYALIVESNTKSISLFHSIGFQQITPMRYVKVLRD